MLPTVTLTGRYLNPDDSPMRGAGLVVRLTAPMLDAGDNVIVAAEAVRITLDNRGAFTTSVVPSDGAGLTPSPVPYEVTEMFGSKRRYTILIPSDQPEVDLSDLAPIGIPPESPSVYALKSYVDAEDALKAPLDSPALTGTPTVNGHLVEDRDHAAATYVPLSALLTIVDNGDGTFDIAGNGVSGNPDGTFSIGAV